MRSPILILILASFAIAEPTTRPASKDIAPKHRPTVDYPAMIMDHSRPAFVPEFAKIKTAPALQEQRDWALRFQPMPVVCVPWGWRGFYPSVRSGYGWAPMP